MDLDHPSDQIIQLNLGDKIAAVTSAVGIKPKEGCGCKKRQEKLNQVGNQLATKIVKFRFIDAPKS